MPISKGLRNTIWRSSVLLLAHLLVSFSIDAQTEFSSIQELFAFADDNSLILKNSGLNEKLYVSKNKESKADLLPDINANFSFNDNITLQASLLPSQIFDPDAPEGEFTEITFGTKYTYGQNLDVQWDILNFQKIFKIEISKSDLLKSQANTELNRFNLYNQLASTYYSIILTQAAIGIYEENVATSDTILENALNQLNKGSISESEYNRALINNKQIKAQLTSNENALQQYYVQLQSQLHTENILTVNDDFHHFNISDSTVFQTHPEILLLEADLASVESQLKQAKATIYPSLSMFYQQGTTWATDDLINFSNANILPKQVFGLNLNITLDFSRMKTVEQSKIMIEQQELEIESSTLEIEKEDELLQLQLAQGYSQLEDDQQILALQTENDQHTENLYEKGIISLDQRLDNYKDLLNAQNSYLNSLAALTLSKYKTYLRQIDFNTK